MEAATPPIADFLDEKSLLDLVPIAVFVRGAEDAEHGDVRILDYDDTRLHCMVDGEEQQETEFVVREGALAWSCTCGEADEHPCYHLIASALATWPGEAPAEE